MTTANIHFNEYNTWDVAKAKQFYADVAGWTFQDVPMPGEGAKSYTLCMSNGEIVAGLFAYTKPMFEGAKDFWLTYIAVEDIHACAAAIEKAGGTILRQPFEVPETGTFVVCDDNAGVTLGFIQPAENGTDNA